MSVNGRDSARQLAREGEPRRFGSTEYSVLSTQFETGRDYSRLLYLRTNLPYTAFRGGAGGSSAAGAASPSADSVGSTRLRGVYASNPSILSSSINRLIVFSISVRWPPCSGVTNEIATPS